MADNVTINAGSGGAVVAADDVSSVWYQRVKLTDGTADSATPINAAGGTAANALRVTIATDDLLLASLAPTTATSTPAAASHTALYTVGPAASTCTLSFANAGASSKQIMIVGASLSIDSGTAVASNFRLHLQNADKATPVNGNTLFDVLSTDLSKYLGYIDLGTPVDLGTSQWTEQNGLAKPVLLSGTTLYGWLTVSSTVTLAAVAHKVTLFTVPLS